jgi:hypothetical protein
MPTKYFGANPGAMLLITLRAACEPTGQPADRVYRAPSEAYTTLLR